MAKNKPSKRITLDDYVRASKRGSREAEQETLGPGFHSYLRVHASRKTYTRKVKHKPAGGRSGDVE